MLATSASEAVVRLGRRDPKLKQIYLIGPHRDEELAKLADCLLAHPDMVTHLFLSSTRLTDETGAKLARYVAARSTLQLLSLGNSQVSEATYLALAAALRVNSSLRELFLDGNLPVDEARVDAAFVEALRLNPGRPAGSLWCLYASLGDFDRLKGAAEQLGHPSLRMLLAVWLLPDDHLTAALRR